MDCARRAGVVFPPPVCSRVPRKVAFPRAKPSCGQLVVDFVEDACLAENRRKEPAVKPLMDAGGDKGNRRIKTAVGSVGPNDDGDEQPPVQPPREDVKIVEDSYRLEAADYDEDNHNDTDKAIVVDEGKHDDTDDKDDVANEMVDVNVDVKTEITCLMKRLDELQKHMETFVKEKQQAVY